MIEAKRFDQKRSCSRGPMIHALDHIALGVASTDAAMQSYAILLGQKARPATSGAASIQLANVRLDFVTLPSASDAGGLAGLAFAAGDLAKARHLLDRRAVRVHMADGRLHGLDISSGESKLNPPPEFVTPYSRNWSLNLIDGVMYTTACTLQPTRRTASRSR